MADLIDADFNQNIEINNSINNNTNKQTSEPRTSNTQNPNEQNNSEKISRGGSFEEAIAKEVTKETKNKIYKSWVDRYLCCFNWLKKYFQIKSNDFFSRIALSIIPFNRKFYPMIENSPDFYGPFWIYTTFIILVSCCGSLARTIQGFRDYNFYQEFIPIACILIYFIGFGVPIFITLLAKLFGGKTNVAPTICIYGYSYTIFLPITIVCSIPSSLLQWVLLAYAIFSSTSLIITSISFSISSITKGKSIAINVIICIFQIIVFFVLKLYFFKHMNKDIMNKDGNDAMVNNSTTTNTNL